MFEHTPLRSSVHYPSISLVENITHIQTFCEHLNVLYIFDQTDLHRFKIRQELSSANPRLIVSPPPLSSSHPPTPPSNRWPALTTLPPLAKFQLVWCRLCESLLSSFAGQKYSSLVTRLILGRRWVNLLPAAQRSNAFNNWRPLRITLRFLV